jgi:hypothetical protein
MKRSLYLGFLAIVLLAAPLIARADDAHTDMVMQHGAQVMPFDKNQAKHMFLPDSTGGVVEIVVHDMDQKQIALVRLHLLAEAAKVARGDYSDPSYIHGKTMPGLAELESSAANVSIRYFETPTGAAITFSSADSGMVAAIHKWLAAQNHDHNPDDMQHCDMKM